MSERTFRAHWLGTTPYAHAHALQLRLVEQRTRNEIPDTLLLLEHPSVITLGRAAHGENVLATRSFLASRNIDVVETERGGDVTMHGPGQLVAYPIFDLNPDRCDVRKYVKDLVRVMSLLCAEHGIGAGGRDDLIGAWVDLDHVSHWRGAAEASRPAKIGAIGVKISRWVTMHGFALNLSTQLADFGLIVPCGISQHPVTSLAALNVLPTPTVEQTARRAVSAFETVFSARCLDLSDTPPHQG